MEELLKIFVVMSLVLAVLFRMRVRYLPMPKQPACGVGDCRHCDLCRENKGETHH